MAGFFVGYDLAASKIKKAHSTPFYLKYLTMGMVKAWMMEQEARGFDQVSGYVCAECFIDPALQNFIKENAAVKKCDYCERRSRKAIAAPFDDVMGCIMEGIGYEWNDPDNEGIAFESREGGYQAELTSKYDLVYDGTYDFSENESVLDSIYGSIRNEFWVERDFYIGTEGQRIQWGWNAFRHEITHKKRFLFLHDENKKDTFPDISPANFLFYLAGFKNTHLDRLTLIREVEPGTKIYRMRIDKKKYGTAADLGAPPEDKASRSNRMSPAGIPMFYGAFDVQTCIAETYDPALKEQGQVFSIGVFEPKRTLRLLDLAVLPSVPSVFDRENRSMIHALGFFHGFANDISKPVSRNGHEHIDYVPTQVVTEFFRHIYRTGAGEKLDGIVYRSSKSDKPACVIFCTNDQSCDRGITKNGCILELTKVRYKKPD